MKLKTFAKIFSVMILAVVGLSSCGTTKHYFIDHEPVELGKTTIGVHDFLGTKIKPAEATIFYYPRTNQICLLYNHSLNKYWNFFNYDKDFTKLYKALETYKESKPEEDLKTKQAKKYYGEITGQFEKGAMLSASMRSFPKTKLGYKKAATKTYFQILFEPAEDTLKIDDNVDRGSTEMAILLSDSAIDDILEFCAPEAIQLLWADLPAAAASYDDKYNY